MEVIVSAHVVCTLSLWEILKMRLAGAKEEDIDKLVEVIVDCNNIEAWEAE